MGFRTVALSTDPSKELAARAFGAYEFIHTTAPGADPAASLRELGGAKVVVATAPDPHGAASLISSLNVNGTLLCLAAEREPMKISPRECASSGRNRDPRGTSSADGSLVRSHTQSRSSSTSSPSGAGRPAHQKKSRRRSRSHRRRGCSASWSATRSTAPGRRSSSARPRASGPSSSPEPPPRVPCSHARPIARAPPPCAASFLLYCRLYCSARPVSPCSPSTFYLRTLNIVPSPPANAIFLARPRPPLRRSARSSRASASFPLRGRPPSRSRP